MTARMLVILVLAIASTQVFAGRSNPTAITKIIVKQEYIEVYTEAAGGCGTNPNRWHLYITHDFYKEMYSGFLASRISGKLVDIVGDGNCTNSPIGEAISWSYVAI